VSRASILRRVVLISRRQEHLMTAIMKAGNLSGRSHRRRVCTCVPIWLADVIL